MTLPKEVGTEDLAKVLGLTPRGVGKLAEKKVLRRLARGSFDLCDCVQAYVAYQQQAALAQHGAGAYGRARAALYLERARVARIQRAPRRSARRCPHATLGRARRRNALVADLALASYSRPRRSCRINDRRVNSIGILRCFCCLAQ